MAFHKNHNQFFFKYFITQFEIHKHGKEKKT